MKQINTTPKTIFKNIYEQKQWGSTGDSEQAYFSGLGSHDPSLVQPYVQAVSTYLRFHHIITGSQPDVVDLGCGDFNVGLQIRPFCNNYTACDIVAPVIAWCKEKYADLNVTFKEVDMLTDPLPDGDILFLRQVLQHLSNDQISTVLKKISNKYRFIVLTEHIPAHHNFTPNVDKAIGANIRLDQNSGVVITQAPFSITPVETLMICTTAGYGGVLRTDIYRMF